MPEQFNNPPAAQGLPPEQPPTGETHAGLRSFISLGIVIGAIGVHAMIAMGRKKLTPEQQAAAAELQRVLDQYDEQDDAGKADMRQRLHRGLTISEIREKASEN